MISVFIFAALLVGIGLLCLFLGIKTGLDRYRSRTKGWDQYGYAAATVMTLMGIFATIAGIWFPFAANQAEKEQNLFTEQCHSLGGSVVEVETNKLECWKERIEL